MYSTFHPRNGTGGLCVVESNTHTNGLGRSKMLMSEELVVLSSSGFHTEFCDAAQSAKNKTREP